MKSLDWDKKGLRVDGKFLSNFRFANHIVIFAKNTTEAETMLRELEAGRKIGLRINPKKTQTKSYVYLGRSMNMDNDIKEELIRRRRAARSAYGSLKEATDQLQMLTSVLIYSIRQFFLLCATRLRRDVSDTSATAKSLQVTHRALERTFTFSPMILNTHTQHPPIWWKNFMDIQNGHHSWYLHKSRLAASKPSMTISKLELSAMVIGANLLSFIILHLNLPIERTFLWTDCKVALTWIKTEKALPISIRNRVRTIHEKAQNAFIRHIPGNINPADIASRGCTISELTPKSLWWNGP
ncbi:unnamed protein product [Nippostrongylus brasiliensis]|uniref:Reverse transcriptase domain-containing protein n=1 Tax=Nippostrongylus brasiliensis TaxID=27835 RepID=A0A0N4YTJ5_NIPBR|nr:unnamed protein product [Nippostrongylus brasiliensis]